MLRTTAALALVFPPETLDGVAALDGKVGSQLLPLCLSLYAPVPSRKRPKLHRGNNVTQGERKKEKKNASSKITLARLVLDWCHFGS